MSDHAGALPFAIRAAVYATAVAAALLAPQPPGSEARAAATAEVAAASRVAKPPPSVAPATSDPLSPSPVRMLLAGMLVIGVALEAARRRAPWH